MDLRAVAKTQIQSLSPLFFPCFCQTCKKNDSTGLIGKGDKSVHGKPVHFLPEKGQKYVDAVISVRYPQTQHSTPSRRTLPGSPPVERKQSSRRSHPGAQRSVSSAHGILCREPDVGLDPRTPGSRSGPKADAQPLSRPDVPQ